MEMQAVSSEAMTHVGHDGQDLHVTYRDGREYVHVGVPAELHEALMNAESKGAFLAKHIRKQYPGVAK